MQETIEKPPVIETDLAHYGDALAPLRILRGARLTSLFRRRDAKRNALKRIEDEEVSWMVEALNAPFETRYSFDFDGQDILTSDGHSFRKLLENGLENALQIARSHTYYQSFVLERSAAEYDNHLLQLQMAKGECPNTMIEFSAMPEAEDDEQERLLRALGSYKIDRQMGIIRISAWDLGTRQMTIYSYSVDNSDTDLFRQVIAERFGIEYAEEYLYAEHLLKKPILIDLDSEHQAALAGELVTHCDDVMFRRDGIQRRAGRAEDKSTNTFEFVKDQSDVINRLMTEITSIDRRRSLNESQQKALLTAARLGAVALVDSRLNGAVHKGSISEQTSSAVAWATSQEKVYDGCGLVVTSGSEKDTLLTYSLLSMNADPTKCVTCPHCDKIVDLPKEEYKKDILHCVECDTAYDKNSKRTIKNYSKQKQKMAGKPKVVKSKKEKTNPKNKKQKR